MLQTARPSDRVALAARISPDAASPGAINSGWVAMKNFEQLLAIVMTGDLGTDGTVDAKLQQATDSSGTGAKDISGKAITQLTTASPSDSDNEALINLRAEELDVSNGFDYVRLVVTVGDTSSPSSATSEVAGLLLGLNPRYGPASDNDAASVLEIVD